METTASPPQDPAVAAAPHGRRAWSLGVVIGVATVVVAVAAFVGIRGLVGNPVRSTDSSGLASLEGSFEPFDCGTPCVGYIQDGARSVTVVLPAGCAAPAREAHVRATGRLDPSQGKQTYRLVACPSPA